MNGDNMKDINSIKISKRDMDKLVRIHEKLVVDFPEGKASESEVLSSIKASGIRVIPKGALKALKQVQIVSVSGEDVYLHPINNKKGGEKVDKKKTNMTSGEDKVAKAILDHFEAGFKAGRAPSEMIFKSCLKTALPKINKKVDAKNAFIKMTDNDYIRVVEGKVVLGDEGKDYLSL